MSITLANVAAGYDGNDIIHDVSWSLNPGEMCAIVGPNGAGKSTLLKAACGLLAPTQGAVLLNGTPLLDVSIKERARHVTVVHQQTEMVFDYSCLDFVLMGAHARSARFSLDSASDVTEALSWLEKMGVRPLAHKPFTAVSGGEAQRVVLARTLMTHAPVWFLDEPTANLDPKHQIATLKLVRAHVTQTPAKNCATVILHDLNMVSRFFDRVVVLHKGTIRAEGSPAETLTPGLLSEVYDVEIQSVSYDDGHLFIVKSD